MAKVEIVSSLINEIMAKLYELEKSWEVEGRNGVIYELNYQYKKQIKLKWEENN